MEQLSNRNLNQFAIASLVMGVLSFLQFFGIEKALAAIIFGLLAWRTIKRTNEGGSRLVIAGIILGVIYIIITLYATITYWPQLMQMLQQAQ